MTMAPGGRPPMARPPGRRVLAEVAVVVVDFEKQLVAADFEGAKVMFFVRGVRAGYRDRLAPAESRYLIRGDLTN